MPDPAAVPPTGAYWSGFEAGGAESAAVVLRAVRDFRRSDAAMRRRTQAMLEMNETDLLAIRHLIRAERVGESIGPKELSTRLGISSAATAKLLSRLGQTGHIRREPHALDQRAQVVHPTRQAHGEIERALGDVHERMRAVAADLGADDRRVVIRFLEAMGDAMGAATAKDPQPGHPASPRLRGRDRLR